jgi:ABC-type phosphate/phosphonate transport system permease subunit
MKDNRPFLDVPRMVTTMAAVGGGIVGLLLSQVFHWSDVQTFGVTIIIALVFVMIAVLVYRAVRRSDKGGLS